MSHPPTTRSSAQLEHAITRREALEELVGSPGWTLFVEHALMEWQGRGYVIRMGQALATAPDATAGRVVHQTALELTRLLEWPKTQLRDLKGIVEE